MLRSSAPASTGRRAIDRRDADEARGADLPLAKAGEPAPPLTIAVVVASRGRPQELGDLYGCLQAQTRPPAQLVLSVTDRSDLPDDAERWEADLVFGPAGSCKQRNRALDNIRPDIDVIAFFDDDYVPREDALELCIDLFRDHSEVVGANGHLVADGINGPGISFEEARRLLAESATASNGPAKLRSADGLYGCNMAFRATAVGGIRFDECLPLNGWQEDIDFSALVGRKGVLVQGGAFVGVHRGVKGARVSGRRFGYSQIVNPAYLARKGTMKPAYALKIGVKNVVANAIRSFAPEPWADRRGRLIGNVLGLSALIRGRGDPRLILDL